MSSAAKLSPINLTEMADRTPCPDVEQALRLSAHCAGAVLEIGGPDHAEHGHRNDGHAHTVYVIISGYGLLHCAEGVMECTGGDVVFMPRGCPHHFERLDSPIRIWRISLTPVMSPG
ncbi:AraC family ligand binding domain-containing protein [Teichococcus vastitatis]|uniref:AraC family ligand binding domain-containing protein n=1 Tax=Teichococcus vastitatis TaxID=2307076 RepID=A0ABS9W8F0_9PROT|nr:AraC family ligand binding domain-containing protein [Pseudoroseomonas vastitatis]MCI0755055.1 AraC family ligand binding domain-containing protein [Pseudoroseomonas vastitatis]